MTDKMLARRDGAIGHMIFNQPEKRNAVSLAMWERATEILDEFENDPEIRVVVLSGAGGKAFVSGADISEFEDKRGTAEAQQHYNAQTGRVYERIERFAKPTIAMINGFCIGGGLNLACVCDIRICSATPLRPTCWNRATTCAASRNFWDTRTSARPRSIRTLTSSIWPRYTTRRTRGRVPGTSATRVTTRYRYRPFSLSGSGPR